MAPPAKDGPGMALRCPDCSAENALGTYYCVVCGAALLPEPMIPPGVRANAPALAVAEADEEAQSVDGDTASTGAARGEERRYRVILGDTCQVCRAASRLSFTVARHPQLPITGCQDPAGCRCSLPIFEAELSAVLSNRDPELAALAPARDRRLAAEPSLADGMVGPTVVAEPDSAGASAPVPPAPRANPPDWTQPSPIMQRRHRALSALTELYHQRRIQGIRVVTMGDCCDICAEVAASLYEPSVAPPLPVVGCWHGWQCRCLYGEEPLPLDARGQDAMRRLERLEHERALRRRGIARGGPRLLHMLAAVTALLIVLGALQIGVGVQSPVPWAGDVVLALGLLCMIVPLAAIGRLRPVPSPRWTYMLSGLVVLLFGLSPLAADRLPAVLDFKALQSFLESPEPLRQMWLGLQGGHQLLALAGLALLVFGLANVRLARRANEQQ